MSPAPTVGRTVLYKLTLGDVLEIERRRKDGVDFGNPAQPGQEYPAVVVRVFAPSEQGTCNLQVLLDGYGSFWATSRHDADSDYIRVQQQHGDYKDGAGCWRWPTKTYAVTPPSLADAIDVVTAELGSRLDDHTCCECPNQTPGLACCNAGHDTAVTVPIGFLTTPGEITFAPLTSAQKSYVATQEAAGGSA